MTFGFDAEAIVDSKGRESTQFFVDYSTGEVTPFECETYEDLWRIMDENLVATCTYHNGEHGAIVEWCIPNGVFSNIFIRFLPIIRTTGCNITKNIPGWRQA